ncbi:glycosyltransferase family 69 protein [Aspergillus clavatus NRRL 1]|uniref:Uncharacterized protein n=1 Tax=Aspergillus clavatus (strain ATCC 1007 / CBS 513.65 / DSM 816 / NCTC 3887 / NRRL 1 / QM 1276 / 107) TaxID=344612 RepID=A1C614_ASPCL|nr:uncharacterized protein ACLA_068630 [Aspergillus clavatus NRRL 1]EAW13835.1 conserved hypothetical protein [Aspergillus clavatus NRRL 1]
MSARLLHPDEYELDARSSVDSQGTFNLDEADFESQAPPRPRRLLNRSSFLSRLFSSTYTGYRRLKPSRRILSASRPSCYRRLLLRRSCLYLHVVAGIVLALVVLTSIFRPSYTRPPSHYSVLRDAVSKSTASGRGNIRNEKVFIAASLYDRGGHLAGGEWGDRVLQLIDLLGKDNVFLSIYENDSGPEGDSALRNFAKRIPSKSSIVSEEHLELEHLPKVTIPGGEKRIKRIEYLAEVRNRALKPLEDDPATRYDKLLYLNDVIFDPVDVLQLLFSTNVDESGAARYRAACAVDFINPFKFYDTYATRDLQGYGMGLPFYPWFSAAGHGDSRKDVLAGKDAVRVRSCWGGMVAFDAKFFQHDKGGKDSDCAPSRFRASHDLFWEASECCLIHADIQEPQMEPDKITDTGIYMNPFVRVAYDTKTFSWLGTTRRFEKLYSFIHNIGNRLVGLPWYNPRRAEVPGQTVQENVWVPDANAKDGGSFQLIDRIAGNDGYCGRRGLQVIVEHRKGGQEGYENIPVPLR